MIEDDDLTPSWLATLHYNGQRSGAGRVVTKVVKAEDPFTAMREVQIEAVRRDGASICIMGISAAEIPRG